MHLICTEDLVRARMAERLAEIDFATAPVRRPAGLRHRFGRPRRPATSASIT